VGIAACAALLAVGCSESQTGRIQVSAKVRTCNADGQCAEKLASGAQFQLYRDGITQESGELDDAGTAILDVPPGSYQATVVTSALHTTLNDSPSVTISGGDDAELTLLVEGN
jgi:hypothetical protein